MPDREGNVLNIGDIVYISDAARPGSRSRRLLRGKIIEDNGAKVIVSVFENNREYSKLASSCLRPLQ